MKFSVLFATVAAGLALSGCSIFPPYIAPEIQTPPTWQATPPHQGQITSLVNWWQQFNDPVLVVLLEKAESDSPTLDKALAAIQSARANIVTSNAQGLPALNASTAASHAKNAGGSGGFNSAGSSNIATSTSGKLDASWEIDLFGGIQFSKQAATARLEAKQSEWHNARVSLAAEVATDYLDYRHCELAVDIVKETLNSRRETLRLTQILSNAGFTAPAEASLAEASLQSSESSLTAQQAQCDSLVKSLVALTNLPEPELRQQLNSRHGLPEPLQFEVTSLPAQLISQRPDLVEAERNLAAASADIGVATASLYPSLSLSGVISRVDTSISGLSSIATTWSFGPALSLPIFDGGKRRAQISQAEANYQIALATYQQSVRDAIKEVEQALVNLDSATLREKSERLSTEQYEKYFNAEQIHWRAGGISLITLEDARRQLINAELSRLSQQHDRVKYWIMLYKALGGGWEKTQLSATQANRTLLEVPTNASTRSVNFKSINTQNDTPSHPEGAQP